MLFYYSWHDRAVYGSYPLLPPLIAFAISHVFYKWAEQALSHSRCTVLYTYDNEITQLPLFNHFNATTLSRPFLLIHVTAIAFNVFCPLVDFAYAMITGGDVCMCTDETPSSLGVQVDETSCNIPCVATPDLSCGGPVNAVVDVYDAAGYTGKDYH